MQAATYLKHFRLFWTLSLALGITMAACTKNNLVGGAARKAQDAPAPTVAQPTETILSSDSPESAPPHLGDIENISVLVIDAKFKGGYDTQALTPIEENHVWVATAAGDVQHLRLDKGVVISKKSWTGATPASGTRTYVLEGGAAVLSKNGGEFYFLHDGLAEGAIDKDLTKGNYFKLTGPVADDRSCVVSYKRAGKRYIGIAYGVGMFVEVEQADTPPYGPKFATATAAVKLADVRWGYSCYIDQNRLQFYSQYFQGSTAGIDLNTKTALDLNKAPNAAFVSTNLPALTIGAKAVGNGSYAMSGDRLGNVFNATGFYTLAFEPKESMVWGTQGTNVSIYPHACLYKTADCQGFATYNLMESIGTGIGPLSALGDGSVVGMVRGVGDVYLLKLKVTGDATKGIDAVKIADKVGNGGDPYMYTDFTGATLYLNNSLGVYDFTKLGAWNIKAPLKTLGFSWLQQTGAVEEWKDIKTEIRCFSSDADKGEFQEVEITAKPKDVQYLTVASCLDKMVTKAELRLTQIGASSSLMGVSKIQLTANQ